MKKWDYIIITLVLIVSSIGFMITNSIQNKTYKEKYIEITLNGKLIKTIDITDSNYKLDFEVKDESHLNTFKVENGGVSIVHANCSDEVCVKSGFIDKVGQTLVCLPHKLIVEIKGIEESPLDDISK